MCDTCGITQQSFLEETQEYQGSHRRTEVRTGPSQQKPVWKPVQERGNLPIKEGIEAYICAFQDLLQIQISQLVQLGMVSTFLPGVVREIWFLHLKKSGILESKFVHDITIAIQDSNSRSMDADSPVQFSKTSTILASFLNKYLPLSLSLAIVFLGCWVARETLDPYDITRLSSCGYIEYLGFWQTFKSDLEPFLSVFSKSFFCPTGVSSPVKLYLESRQLANFLNIKCPAINIMAWNERYIHALGLQEDILAPLSMCQILYGGRMNSLEYFNCHETKTPWSSMAAKSAFYLDQILRCSKERDTIDKTIRSSFQNLLEAAKLMPNNITPIDVMQMNCDDLQQFLVFLKDTHFQFEPFQKFAFILEKLPALRNDTTNNNFRRCRIGVDSNAKIFTSLCDTPEIRQASFQDTSFSTIQLSLSFLSWTSSNAMVKV